jgi:hypothetical protein
MRSLMRGLAIAVVFTLAAFGARLVHAQDAGLGGSFITPFPENDTYQVQVVGDWMADGLNEGLVETFATSPAGIAISRKRYDLPGLLRGRGDIEQLEKTFANDPSHVAIVLLGAQDRYSIGWKRAGAGPGNDEARNEFVSRVDRAMKALKKGGRGVYWVGLPTMRRFQDNERAQLMNDVFRERAYLNGVRYIDTFANFIDEQGGYTDWGPDVTGKVSRLRDTDGVHFTQNGYRMLAHIVERELRRDITQARQERSIPLAGDATEQSQVNPDRAKLKADAARGQDAVKAKAAAAASKGVAAPAAGGARDQKADPGKVDVKIAGPDGTEQVVTIDIVRPAIPAAIVDLVTRKQSADQPAQMGDVLVDQIPGGLTVMSSIVPPRGADGRRRLSPTQAPYYRVFERGERLVPKPGRADDFAWPRPQATAALPAAGAPDASEQSTGATEQR